MLPKFNTFTPFFLKEDTKVDWAHLEDALKEHVCPGIEDMKGSYVEGFMPIIDDQLVLSTHRFLAVIFRTIDKKVPADVVRETVQIEVKRLEQKEGRKIGRKEKTEIKEQVFFMLTDKAFPRAKSTLVIIDKQSGRVLVGAGSKAAETAVACLRRALGSLPVLRMQVDWGVAFHGWATGGTSLPAGWEAGNKLTLAGGVENGKVAYTDIDLEGDDVQERLKTMMPKQIAIHAPDRMGFTLKDDGTWAGIKYFAERDDEVEDGEQALQADLFYIGALISREISSLQDSMRPA